jgi:hypothetical protein
MDRAVLRRSAEAGYVAVIASLAAFGAVRTSAPCYLAAVALTLPCGLAALVLMYGGYALISGVGGLWASTTRTDGDQAAWLATGSSALNVAVLVAAALANVLLLERRSRRSRRSATA